MDRIPLYTDLENLMEIYSLDRNGSLFMGMRQLISKEAKIIINDTQEEAEQKDVFPHIMQEFASGDYQFEYRNEEDGFLAPPFKTNLQERFKNKSSLFFCNDCGRVELASEKNGILIAGLGSEHQVYNQLNYDKEFFRANRILTIGTDFVNYQSLEPYILPFTEIIINEPYLFVPERRDFVLEPYLANNFEQLSRVLFSKAKNKVNIVFCTFINEHEEHTSYWYDIPSKSFKRLFDYIKNFLNQILGGARYKLWLVISPMARQARHDRYVVTNYQYIECGAGLTFFDHNGNFINRGEGMHLYSIMHDDARKSFMPQVINRLQTIVVDSVKATKPNRIFGAEQGNSSFLNFS